MKANSERVKGKNFRDFNGKPLFRWILDTLLSVDEIDQVIINTDARHILAENGLVDGGKISIRDRSERICGDLVSMNKIIGDDIAHSDGDIYLQTHTTNPLLSADSIRGCINKYQALLKSGDADSLFTVDKIQTRFYREDGSAINHDPDNLLRTQDLEPWFEENSNLYVFNKTSFEATQARIGRQPGMYVNSKFESIDIDEPQDWDMAVVAGRYLMEQGKI